MKDREMEEQILNTKKDLNALDDTQSVQTIESLDGNQNNQGQQELELDKVKLVEILSVIADFKDVYHVNQDMQIYFVEAENQKKNEQELHEWLERIVFHGIGSIEHAGPDDIVFVTDLLKHKTLVEACKAKVMIVKNKDLHLFEFNYIDDGDAQNTEDQHISNTNNDQNHADPTKPNEDKTNSASHHDKNQEMKIHHNDDRYMPVIREDELEKIKPSGVHVEHGTIVISVNDPYYVFSVLSQILYHNDDRFKNFCVFDYDNADEVAQIIKKSENLTVGLHTRIHHSVQIGNNVSIGNNVVIYPNVTIYNNVSIGDNCIIHAGCVIGADGFGFAPHPKSKHWSKIEQIGGVVIGNNVEIGANTAIDAGTIDPTIIGDGVIIDNLVQIAHNVEIGDHSAIAACVGIAGSTKIGKFCQIAGAANITGHITITDHTIIGGGAGISKSITKPDIYMSYYPFSNYKEWAKNAIHIKQLDNMHKRITALELEIKELHARVK